MTTSELRIFSIALRSFAHHVTAKFALHVAFQPEDQLKESVAALTRQAGQALGGMAVEVVTEVREGTIGGRPDMGVTVKGLLTGYIELKAPGKGANPQHFKGDDKTQWEKFKNLPNLIYTDGNEWALYRNGNRIGKLLRLTGDVTKDSDPAASDADAAALMSTMRDFLGWQPVAPTTPKGLAELLAPLCRLLRTEVLAALEDPNGNLSSLAQDWRKFFFPDADDKQFADAYAQTLTYALLLARLAGAGDLSAAQASKHLRTGHRLLADVLNRFGDDAAREDIKVSADLLERLIGAVNPAILTRHGNTDPWLYFYEDFLAAYDPKMRKDRGVYYTPVEVVQCQVRLVAELLAHHFNADFSFIDDHVVTLDPATGTGTYILAAVQHALDQVAAVRGPGARVSAATTAAKNMHAFELLVGPYAVAHLRLTQQIAAEQGKLPADGVHVYLTDALESPNAAPEGYLPLPYKQLAEEHRRALKVKKDTPVLVCIGNPPYDRQTIKEEDRGIERRKGGWVRFGDPSPDGRTRPILDDFLDPLKGAGLGGHAKNIYNDYVYFWRWALWKVFEQKASPGIISFITAASYLRGPGFAGMRKVMRQTFDDLWIINLEGDNLGARKTENVFAIQTPVAIAIGVRYGPPQPDIPATVWHTRISGTEEEKLARLKEVTSFNDLPWRSCFSDWLDLFLPAGDDAPYWTWPLLTDLFPWQANGVKVGRTWPIAGTKDELHQRWKILMQAKDRKSLFKDSPTGRKVHQPARPLPSISSGTAPLTMVSKTESPPPIIRYAYRSFDREWLIADARLLDRHSPGLWRAHGGQQVYMTSLLTEVLGEGSAAIATALLPDLHHFRGSFGGAHVTPLWRNPAASEPNITHGVLDTLQGSYGRSVAPEDLFAYCYALLSTPEYVQTFWDELTIPGPRIPITKDAKLFDEAAALGKELVWLHSYGERWVPAGKRAGKIPIGKAQIKTGTPTEAEYYPEDFSYEADTQELQVGKGVFSNVASEVWSFSVSGLQVVKSWLDYRKKDRAGKKSSKLDDIRPSGWQFDEELLDLLWVLEATIARQPQATALLAKVCNGDLFSAHDFPKPTAQERKGPKSMITGTINMFDAEGEEDDEEKDDDDE